VRRAAALVCDVRRGAAAAAALAATLAACGTPSADLLVIERSGSLPDARLTLRVGDGGAVRCDGGPERQMARGRLLEARDLARDLAPLLDRGLALPAAPASLLTYRVTGEQGTVRFTDASPGLTPELGRLLRFTRSVARETCGRER
jgi:hypothetical protein